MRRRSLLVLVCTLASASLHLTSANAAAYETRLISSPGQDWEISEPPAISDDGRFVAFASPADDLSTEDRDGISDIYVRDQSTGDVELVSRAYGANGTAADRSSYSPSISADGRRVAFVSSSTNLDADVGPPGTREVFVRDLDAHTTRLVSRLSEDSPPANSSCYNPAISGDGGSVAFSSAAQNLWSGSGPRQQVYVRDISAGVTEAVGDLGSIESRPYGASAPAISSDGRFVSFVVTIEEPERQWAVFRLDRSTHQVDVVSGGADGTFAGSIARPSSVSDDGRFVAFKQFGAYQSGQDDAVLVRDMSSETAYVASVYEHTGDPSLPGLSRDGRFVVSAGSVDGSHVAERFDLATGFTKILDRASGADGALADSPAVHPVISGDGRMTAFISEATNLAVADPSADPDVFTRELPLDDAEWPLTAGPEVTIGDAVAGEGSDLTFSIALSEPSGRDLRFFAQPSPGSALATEDFAPDGQIVVVQSGTTSASFTVAANTDWEAEDTEQFSVSLHPFAGDETTVIDSVGIGSILEIAPRPVVSIADASSREDARDMVFLVALTEPTDHDVTFHLQATDVTAHSIGDFGSDSGLFTIPAGETLLTHHVRVIDDAEPEATETFEIAVTDVFGAGRGDTTAVGTILDAPLPSIWADDVVLPEGGQASFVFHTSRPVERHVSVETTTMPGTATTDDYYSFGGRVVIQPGSTTSTHLAITHDDLLDEPSETYTLRLHDPKGVEVIDDSAIATILDEGLPVASVDDLTVVEGDVANFRIRLSKPATEPVHLALGIADVTATSYADWFPGGNGVTIPIGGTSAKVRFETLKDTIPEIEPTEYVQAALTSYGGASVGDGAAVGAIVDWLAPKIDISAGSMVEARQGNESFMAFPLRLSRAYPFAVSVTVETKDGTAKAYEDYIPTAQTITFPAGVQAKTFQVRLTGDDRPEKNETIKATLSNPYNGTIGNATAVGTIYDADL